MWMPPRVRRDRAVAGDVFDGIDYGIGAVMELFCSQKGYNLTISIFVRSTNLE